MATQTTCDYCGEPIEDRDPYKIEIRVWGLVQSPHRFGWSDRRTPIGPQAHYHASDDRCCWAFLLDKIHEAQEALGEYPHTIIEERHKYHELRGHWEEQGRLGAREAADRKERCAHARAEWDAIGAAGRLDRIRSVFADVDEWLTSAEIVNRINGFADVDFLYPGDESRRIMRRLVDEGSFEAKQDRRRYSYRPVEQAEAVA